MEVRTDKADALKSLKVSFGWQVIKEQLMEDRATAMNTFMRATSMEDVAMIKAKIMIIDWVINMPDALINQSAGEASVAVDELAQAEPVVSDSTFKSA